MSGIQYDLIYRLPTESGSLTGYKFIILVESSFISPSYMQAALRDSLKAFLLAGTPQNKKGLLVLGGDFGYNYDRSASTQRDTILTRNLMGFNYVSDNGSNLAEKKITGLLVNPGLSDSTISTLGNFYPDALSAVNGAEGLYKHKGRTTADSLVCVGLVTPGYTSVCMAVDPRYITEAASSPGGGNKRMIDALISYIGLTVVPVELTSFTASVTGNGVQLNWSTATETNNSGFAIERKHGTNEFQQIAFVDGKGTSTNSTSYLFTDNNVSAGIYQYRLKQIDYNGTFEIFDAVEVDVLPPAEFSLSQNYPNPFNPSTSISYSLAFEGMVKLSVFNSLGEKVSDLVNEYQNAGRYKVQFDASGLASGIYIYRLETPGFNATNKMILNK